MGGRPGFIEPRAVRALVGRAALAAAAIGLLTARDAEAQEASGYMELTAGQSDVRSEDRTGQRTDSQNDSFLQRYSFDLGWRLYPNLQVLAGGLFERDAATAEGDLGTFKTTQRKIRPYLTAALQTAIASATLGYYRNEDDLKSAGVSTGNIQEITNTTLGWRPEDLPSVTLRYIRTHDFDTDRRTQDTIDDTADLVSEYQPVDKVQLYYRGALEDFSDRLADLEIRRRSQAGRVTYGDAWWNQRVQMGAEYDVNYRETEVTTGGAGEVVSPLFPIGGLSTITDTPATGALAPNPGLIDADRTASAGINLGLPPLGGDVRPRNIGLDFGGATRVNILFVWVDRDLPPGIADSFSWDIYTSSDNLTWVLRQTVSPATFGPFETRFEIRFADLTARYVKAVTRPLARTVPSSGTFPDILVTECTAAIRVPASEARGRTSLTSQVLTSSVRARILNSPSLYYELSYFARDVGPSPFTYILSNGLSLGHTFNPVYSAAARVAREDSRESEGDRRTYLYSASLRAVPLQTLQHSLLFSGRSSEIDGRSSSSSSVFLYSTAELYRGVNANVGLGQSIVTGEGGDRTDTTQINAEATLVPHPSMTMNLLFQSSDGKRRGGSLPAERSFSTSASQASLAYRPLTTLYLFFSYRLEQSSRLRDRYLRNYAASWSPFPDGRLQLLLSFDDSYQSDLDSLTRTLSPRVRWNITDRWYAELAYQKSSFDSAVETSTAESLTGSMRIWF